ncbi:hypothetical protein TrVE_jg11097 [Triparma verrucosa]|uniref:Tyrosine-protein kinase ephrin type A/B receptor-like domain-containing protein n=1 Tax=Triparma verrucosa TaxID=1606542 RepID=A0A9W7C7R5_9STRA|nr:hypothetical protein TrVE_jg11097 [Triparma verrucosa]
MGTYNTNVGSGAASDCAFCPTGKINPDTTGASSVSACQDCAAGQGASSDSTSCESCTAGTYGPATGLGCFQCGRGKYSEAVGATAETQCQQCPEGKSSPIGVPSHCETCTAGTYAPGEGYASCSTCNPGTSCGEGATEMDTCQAGSASGAGSASCGVCLAGSYSNSDGSSECITCQAGKYCGEGATEMLTCPKGKYSNFGASSCTKCGPSTIAPETSTMACSACDSYQVASDERTECVCQQGYYVGEDANKALPVPDGVSPNTAGMTIETLDILPGFWRTSNGSTEVLSCLNEEHCKGGNNTADLCSEGYTGPLCAVCASGFAATGNGELLVCNECTGASIFTVLGVLAVVFVLITAILIIFLKGTSERIPPPFKTRSSSVSEKYENFSSRLSKIEPIVKIITAYFQVAGGLSFVYGLKFPKFFSTVTNWVGGIFSLNFIAFMPLGCSAPVNHYTSLLVYTGLPILLGIVLIASSKLASKPELRNKIFEVFLTMTFILLPSVSVKIFSTFACKDFDDGKSFLKVDYSIACDEGPEYWFYWTYAMAMIAVYPVGIPLMYFILVYRKRDLLECEQGQLEESMSDNAALKEALKIRAKNEEENETLKSLRFLYGAYEPKYWWFEIFETLRKLALTGFLVFLAPGTAAQIAISMLMGLATLRVQSGTKPYIEAVNDKFAEVAMWQLFLTMFAALCLKVNLDDESLQDQGYFDMTLTLIQFLPLILVLLQDVLTIQDQGNDAKDEAISLSQDAVEVGVRGARAITESVDTAIATFKTGAVLGGGSEIEMKSKTNKDQVRGENPAVQLNSKNNEGGGLLGEGQKKTGDDYNI